MLNNGKSAFEAATEAVRQMEDCDLWNCGKGAVFTRDGNIELEASVGYQVLLFMYIYLHMTRELLVELIVTKSPIAVKISPLPNDSPGSTTVRYVLTYLVGHGLFSHIVP